MMKRVLVSLLLLAGSLLSFAGVGHYVDPRIGTEGLGRTVIAPSVPFGMVKPSPDCTSSPNSGWLPMPERVDGFAQVHVSGTGGGPKYGNILIQPFSGELEGRFHYAHRKSEDASLGYYSTEFEENGIRTEITTAAKASFYRITYPAGSRPALSVDAGFFLGENPVPKAREAQQFEGSFAEVVSDHEVRGWSTISGGWNNGAGYTVYFHLVTDRAFDATSHWEENGREGELLGFADGTGVLNVKIGISFLSMDKARANLEEQIDHWSFDKVLADCRALWEKELSRVNVNGTKAQKRMFYTALYHTMLMPVDRTGEWDKCDPSEIYYDDYYAIWDTYRTSSPLLAIIDPQREADIVNALLNIYRKDGFLPDARSGNSNGRTQGGSNAEIVIADAFVKGLPGIDWELALEAMIKDAEVVPADDEAEGRGGLQEYNSLGYVPWGIDRAGNRTVEYAMCDYAIYTVAKGLGKDDIAAKYLERSSNWKNLWRADTECDGVRGFVMPRSAAGEWLDDLTFGHSAISHPTYRYTTTMFEGPWYVKWWSSFFYEASSWEYSLSIPHDVPGLVEACGGADSFEKRLDTFFGHGYYNVNNEPSFLTPCLYHWIGKPEKTSARVLQIIDAHFNDSPAGLPGNDDSGAMSSWLAFHMTGLYPLAGDSLYVIHTPVLRRSVFRLANGKTFTVKARGLSARRNRVVSARLNGKKLDSFFLSHNELMEGGKLVLVMGKGEAAPAPAELAAPVPAPGSPAVIRDTLLFTYKLHGQTRRFTVHYDMLGDSLRYNWEIERNLKMWHGSYTMSPEAMQNGGVLSSRMPEDGNHLVLGDDELFNMLSRKAYSDVIANGRCRFAGTEWKLADRNDVALSRSLLHLVDVNEGAQMWVLDIPQMPVIWKMQDNPLEQNWTCSSLDGLRNRILGQKELTGGIYYAYPVHEIQPETAAPRGYEPFYVSHYGRHGSRYLTEDRRYQQALEFFEGQALKGNLTPVGQEVLEKLRALWPEVEGLGGLLSVIGEQQHHDIAARLCSRYPTLFAGEGRITAVSSTKPRCIASMNFFCNSLEENNPQLEISRDSDPSNMAYIAYNTPEVKADGDEYGSFWAPDFRRFEVENIHPERLCSSLLKNSAGIYLQDIFDWLYWIAVDIQDIPADIDFLCYFTPDELFGKWRTVDFRMYLQNCNAPLTRGVGPASAKTLLADFLEDATAAVAGNGLRADLRFGHDTNLIRLLSLMGVEECSVAESDPEEFWRAWQDWNVSPMAANLQLVFYLKSASSPVLVKFLLNEHETRICGVKPVSGPYYDWAEISAHWEKVL